jgi:hydrogenase maturation protease
VNESGRPAVLVIGVGNELRGDDGAGLVVVRRLAARARAVGLDVEEEQNDSTGLIERWRGRNAVVLVDAVVTEAPGTVLRFDASQAPLPARPRGSSSTHAVAVYEAIELARVLGGLPDRVVVYAVGGATFEAGAGISPVVAAAVPALAEQVLAEAMSLTADGSR